MLIRSFAAYRHVFALILSSFLLLSLPDAASGAPQNVTIRFDSSQVPASFTTGWRVAEFKGSGLSGSVDKFAFANYPGEELIVQLPQNVIALSYRGFKIKGGGLYYACLDCDASVDTAGIAVTVDAHDETENGTQPPETLFAFTDVDPTQSHVLRVINLEDDRFNETSQITFDSLVLTFKDEDSTVSSASSNSATPTVPSGGNPTTTVTVSPTDGSSSASTGTTSGSLRTGMAMTSSSDSQATTPSASGNGGSGSQTRTSSNPSPTASGSQTQTRSSATGSRGLQSTSSAGSSPGTGSSTGFGSDTTSSAAPGNGASNGGVSKTVIIVVAVIASVFVLALLAAIIWLLVRNQPPPRGDVEGSAGVMRQAAPAAITVSGPFPLSPMRPEIPNPFVDPLDELSAPPRPAPPPPIPLRSPLRATGDRPAWLTRVPRTPSPESPNE